MANKNYSVDAFVVGQVVYVGKQNKAYKSGNSADIFTVMFRTPEGVTGVAEKKIFASTRTKGMSDFMTKWEASFDKLAEDFKLNKPAKIPMFIRFAMKPSDKGMFGDVSAKINDKGERLIRFSEVLVSEQPYEMDGEEVMIKYSKSTKKFSEIQTRFTVNMIAQEINDEEIVWVDGEGEYPVVLETVSRRDNSPIEIGQGYSFIATLEKGKAIKVESEDFSWDNEATTTYSNAPSLVIVEKPLGRVKNYNMSVDFLGEDATGGF